MAVCLLCGSCITASAPEYPFVLGCEFSCFDYNHRTIKKGSHLIALCFLFKCKEKKI